MPRERVEMPEGFEDEVKSAQDSEGAIWTNFKVMELRDIGGRTNKDGSLMQVRDCSWGFCGRDEENNFLRDEKGDPRWYTIKATLWNKRASETGKILAELFAYGLSEKGARCRIIFEPKACYGELGSDRRVWYKHEDPDKWQVYVSRPMKNKCTQEQNALWDTLEAKAKKQGLKVTNWINLHDAEPIDPFGNTSQEEEQPQEEQKPIAVPVEAVDEDDEVYDGSLL